MTPSSNCYELLGVSSSANNAELRKAFRQLSKRLHPDTTSLPSDEATRQFQKVCEAYDLLSDPVLRANYDLTIEKEHNLTNSKKVRDILLLHLQKQLLLQWHSQSYFERLDPSLLSRLVQLRLLYENLIQFL